MVIRKPFRNLVAAQIHEEIRAGWGFFELADSRDQPILIGIGRLPDDLRDAAQRLPYLRRYRAVSATRRKAIVRYLAEVEAHLQDWPGPFMAPTRKRPGAVAPVSDGKLDRWPFVPSDLGLWWDGMVIPFEVGEADHWRERGFQARCPGGTVASLALSI